MTTATHSIPNIRQAGASCRMKFDWVAPQVTITFARRWIASARKYSILRPLLPPKANPVRSSRLIQRSIPRASEARFSRWRGVGARINDLRDISTRHAGRGAKDGTAALVWTVPLESPPRGMTNPRIAPQPSTVSAMNATNENF
jgi:hypothetical protein